MKSETKNCQNCKKDFTIEPDDFGFYEKIKVPPPTFCPECRLIRRLVWRNERISFPCIMNLCLFLCIVGSAGMGTAGTPPLTDGNTIWQGRFLSNIKSFPILSRG